MSMYGFWADFITVVQVLVGVFLIFIIMLQRGKGGGLVGALGGMGGASAFGPKADVQVLKLTIGLAVAWVFFACVGIFINREYAPATYGPTAKPAVAAEATKATDKAADNTASDKNAKAKPGTDDKAGPELTPSVKTEVKGAEKPADKQPAEEKKPAATTPAADKKPAAPAKEETPAAKTDAEKK